MKDAIMEYYEITKLSAKWLKKHWKGYSVLCMALVTAPTVYRYRRDIETCIKNKLSKR